MHCIADFWPWPMWRFIVSRGENKWSCKCVIIFEYNKCVNINLVHWPQKCTWLLSIHKVCAPPTLEISFVHPTTLSDAGTQTPLYSPFSIDHTHTYAHTHTPHIHETAVLRVQRRVRASSPQDQRDAIVCVRSDRCCTFVRSSCVYYTCVCVCLRMNACYVWYLYNI